MTGTVLWGVNNIYAVRTSSGQIECRIKGKILSGEEKAYNPLAPGDYVEIEVEKGDEAKGMIIRRNTRKNRFARWNKKRQAPQVIAANIDGCFCITSPESPPFRPRFIDRVTVTAAGAAIPVTVVCNKADQQIPGQVHSRLSSYGEAGYAVVYSSAVTGAGMEEIFSMLAGRRVLFLGQSGVGKSTMINFLIPGLQRKTADISSKYNRGKHTTVYSELLEGEGFELIDTPGIREIELFEIQAQDLGHYFPDIVPYLGSCRFPSCRHVHEPDCGVKQALEEGKIHHDRYESYCRMLADIEEKEQFYG